MCRESCIFPCHVKSPMQEQGMIWFDLITGFALFGNFPNAQYSTVSNGEQQNAVNLAILNLLFFCQWLKSERRRLSPLRSKPNCFMKQTKTAGLHSHHKSFYNATRKENHWGFSRCVTAKYFFCGAKQILAEFSFADTHPPPVSCEKHNVPKTVQSFHCGLGWV